MRRTKLEKETIINFNEAEDTAQIYTFNAALKQRLFSFSRQHPELCQLVRKSEDGSVTYSIEKSRISIRFLPPISAEQREKRSENMRKNRQQRKGGDAQTI